MTPEEKLKELGLELPIPGAPVGNFLPAVRTGNLVFVSGNGPRRPDGSLIIGKVGSGLSIDEGYEAARRCALSCLGGLAAEIGSLSKVVRFVKLLGMVNCSEDFGEQPKVINGASDLLVAVFGDAGRHARSAVGMQSLPFGMAVEVEMVVEVEET